MIRPRTARRLILRHIQALARPNLNSTESVEAVQRVGTYIRVVACSLDDVRGGVVHGNGSGRGHRVARLTTLVSKYEDVKTFLKLFWVVFARFGLFLGLEVGLSYGFEFANAPTSIAVYYSATHIIEGTSYDFDVSANVLYAFCRVQIRPC